MSKIIFMFSTHEMKVYIYGVIFTEKEQILFLFYAFKVKQTKHLVTDVVNMISVTHSDEWYFC